MERPKIAMLARELWGLEKIRRNVVDKLNLVQVELTQLEQHQEAVKEKILQTVGLNPVEMIVCLNDQALVLKVGEFEGEWFVAATYHKHVFTA